MQTSEQPSNDYELLSSHYYLDEITPSPQTELAMQVPLVRLVPKRQTHVLLLSAQSLVLSQEEHSNFEAAMLHFKQPFIQAWHERSIVS